MFIIKTLALGLGVILTSLAGWLGYQQNLGATIPVSVAVFETTLSAKITTTDTLMTLVTGTDKAGNGLNGYLCFTLDGGKTNEEFVCGTASSTAVSSLLRGLDPVTAATSTALAKEHRAGASVKITDYPQLAIVSRILNGDDTIPNTLHYTTDTMSITNLYDVPTKYYVDHVATSGASDANYTVEGVTELGVVAEIAAGTATGGTGAYLVPPSAMCNAVSSANILIPVTSAAGKLSQGFLDLTQAFTWSGVHSFASTTFNKTLAVTGTSTFTGVATFAVAPTINATATLGTDAINKNFLLNYFKPSTTTQASTTRFLSNSSAKFYYPNSSTDYMVVNASFKQTLLAGIESTIQGLVSTAPNSTATMALRSECYEVDDAGTSRRTCSMTLFVPPTYYYQFATVSGGLTGVLSWTETY